MARVGPNYVTQNGNALSAEVPGRAAYDGSTVNSDIHGQYFENIVRGQMFAYGVASAALVIKSDATGFPTIWNPAGSNTICVPVGIGLSFISGTTVIGGLIWTITLAAGASKGTGLPIITHTAVAATNLAVGATGYAAKASVMNFAPSVVTFTTAPSFLASTGINVGAVAPTNGGGPGFGITPVNGIVVFPGTALSLNYTVTTSTALFAVTIYGLELPMPTGY